MYDQLKIFAGSASPVFTQKISKILQIPVSSAEVVKFSDGELFVRIKESVRGADVFIIQSTCFPANQNIMELLMMIDAAKRASARRVTAVIPYFGYARQDRKNEPRVAITAKLIANLITTAGADRVLTMDLHAPQIQGFFDIPLDHLYASPVFIQHYQSLNLNDFVVVSPDLGSVKMNRAYAKELDLNLALIDKRRPKPNQAEVVNIIGKVRDKKILIQDDMIDTGGTIIEAARLLKKKGAKSIYVGCTHPVFSNGAAEQLEQSAISTVFVADTMRIKNKSKSKKIKVISVTGLFAEAIKRINLNESVSILFDRM